MARTVPEQIQQLIDSHRHILIVLPKTGGGDAIGSSIALALWLEKLQKQVEIASDEFVLPRNYRFLKRANTIVPQLSQAQKFILSVDVREHGLESLTYDVKDEILRIFVTPKTGVLTRDLVRTSQSDFVYDLIITVGTTDLKSLGKIYSKNTELFFKTPVINLDHHAQNEHFGQINAVTITATTVSEVVFALLQTLDAALIDKDIATALLTGIIAQTRSFKNDATKPEAMMCASTLIGLGANRDAIVQALFRTRTIATLKLWGYALRHLQSDPAIGLVWTTITRDDFSRSGAQEPDLSDIIDELISNSPEAKIILLLH